MSKYSAGSRWDFWVDVAREEIDGSVQQNHKFGANPDIDVTAEDIWTSGGAYTGWLTAAAPMRIRAGGNAADTAAGAGAQSVRIEGLDANWNEIGETVATAGAAQSLATSASFIRVNRLYVVNAGAYGGTNTGIVSVETTGGTLVATIGATQGQSEMCIYTIPAGKTGIIPQVSASVDTAKTATVRFYARRNADDVTGPSYSPRRLWHIVTGLSGAYTRVFTSMPVFPPKTDVWVSATGPAGGASVEADICFLLVPERV